MSKDEDEEACEVAIYFCPESHLHIEATDKNGDRNTEISLDFEDGVALIMQAMSDFCNMTDRNFLLLTDEEMNYIRSLLSKEDGFEDTIGPTMGNA